MKSKDVQKAVKTKYENEDGPAKIHRDLGGVVSKRTTTTGSIELAHFSDHLRIVANISKVKW